MTEHEQLHALVQGRVQGVNFRYFTLMRAEELGLTGWVRNLPDRSVEVVAEGPRHQLETLLAYLNQGPPASRVIGVDVEWREAAGQFRDFQIR